MVEADVAGQAGPSSSTPKAGRTGKAPSSARTKRKQSRLSLHSPYPTPGSPKTPQRSTRGKARQSAIVDEALRSPASPQSPSMRALNAIVSFISPFSSARHSAAFGKPSEEEETVEEEVEEEDDVANRLYPTLPSSPAALLSSSIHEDDHDEIVSGPEVGSEDHVDATIVIEDEAASSATSVLASPQAEIDVVEIVEDGLDTVEANLPRIEEPLTPFLELDPMSQGTSHVEVASVGQSEPESSSHPPKLSFEAFSSKAPDTFANVAQSYRSESQPRSASRFTFGGSSRDAVPRLPAFSRASRQTRNISPLAKNYDLLARFFAEKAEQEARAAEGTPSVISMDEDGGGAGGLTEVELAGCMRLIEQSFAHGQGAEIERLRREALARGRPQSNSGDAYGATGATNLPNDILEDPVEHHRFLSRSPSLPLGATANASPSVQAQNIYGIRPSTSFLAPSVKRSHEDAMVTQSLNTAFQKAPLLNVAQRRHRPLYLGPGMGAKSSAALRRQQQQQSASRRTALGAYKTAQQSYTQNNVSSLQGKAKEDEVEAPTKRRRLPGERDDAPALFAKPPTATSSPSPAVNISIAQKERKEAQAAAPPQISQTADAMLSILRSGPSIPLRTSVPTARSAQGSSAYTGKADLTNPEVVNPYERETRLSKRSRASASSSSLAAKEKERLREEREKRQKAMKEREARKETTLEFLQRTAPPSTRTRLNGRAARRIAFDEEDAVDGDNEESVDDAETLPAPSTPVQTSSTTPLVESSTASKSAGGDEERRRKNEELRRRTEQLLSKAKASQPAKEPTQETPPSSSLPVKSMPFNAAFAPKKPSPLSQAASSVVPDSPSGSSEASERESSRILPSPAKSLTSTASKQPIVIDDDDDEDSPASQTSKVAYPLPPFKVDKPTSMPQPSTAKATPVPSPSFTFADNKEPSSASAPAPSTNPQDEARSENSSSLPKFDFALKVIVPSGAMIAADDEARKAALAVRSSDLPRFDFAHDVSTSGSDKDVAAKANGADSSTFSAKTTTFNFKAIPTAAPPPKANGTEAGASEAASASSNTSEKSVSALLSGSGEGEEDEESEHEVRCKVWNLSEGKWNDLGIGMLRIKKHKSTGKSRVLMRNEGNGKVTVNFNLLSTFKANVDKTIVTFLGFDQTGKPTNFRVKIKTEAGASDLKSALDKSVAAIQ